MMFDAGEFNQRIDIQSPPTQVNGLNEYVGEWPLLKRVWARVRPLSAREYTDASQAQDEAVYKFFIRYNAQVNGTQRIVWLGKVYAIKGEPLTMGGGAGRYMQITGVLQHE